MIRITIEVEGPDGRIEVEAIDNLQLPNTDWEKRVASLAAQAVKKVQGAIKA